MRVVSALAVSILLTVETSNSQLLTNDRGVRDTLALSILISPSPGTSSSVAIGAWVYSDNDILSFSAGFTWNNFKMRLDSAMASPILSGTENHVFLYPNDDLATANWNRTFVLKGFTSGPGIPGDYSSRRLWATYFFTVENWNYSDTISLSAVPGNESELAFVAQGPIYPVEYRPFFNEPVLFPGIATSLQDNENAPILPKKVTLFQNYPNPFNPITTIEFNVPRRCHISLDIFNSLGQHIMTLTDREHSSGEFQYNWDAINELDDKVSSGVYFYRLRTPNVVLTKKMTLLK